MAKFRSDVKAKVNVEPGLNGAPCFRIEIDELKRREIEGFSGVVARLLGQYFDELVTQIASGRASKLNRKLNDEIMKRINVFKDYGILCGVDYAQTGVVLSFDVTRFRLEGITGYVFAGATKFSSTLSMAPSQGWLSLLHDDTECARSSEFGQRRHNLPRIRSPSCGCGSRLSLGARAAMIFTLRRRTEKIPDDSGFARMGLPITSIKTRSQIQFLFIVSTTRSGTNISTRSIPMPSLPSRRPSMFSLLPDQLDATARTASITRSVSSRVV